MKANSFQERVCVTEGNEEMPRITTNPNPNTPGIIKLCYLFLSRVLCDTKMNVSPDRILSTIMCRKQIVFLKVEATYEYEHCIKSNITA